MEAKQEVLAMNEGERERAHQMRRIKAKQASHKEVAQKLDIGRRQVRRLYRRWRQYGDKGLVSQRRGKASNRRREGVRSSFVSWYGNLNTKGRYRPSQACQCYEEETGVRISKESSRQWLMEAGYWQAKRQKAATPHPPRRRRGCRGELVQIDGSVHNWLGAWRWTLIEFVDDATSEVLAARFVAVENTHAYFEVLAAHIAAHGLPRTMYSDRHAALFSRPLPDGSVLPTAFGLALERLEIGHIPSDSAQGRGRVERAHGTAQDRLVKEMANRVDISGMDEAAAMAAANEYLADWCVRRNRRFAVLPRESGDAHRECSYNTAQLRLILSLWHERRLSKNATFSFGGVLYVVTAGMGEWRRRQRPTVDICQHRDGDITVYCNNRQLTVESIDTEQRQQQAVGGKELNDEVNRRLAKPWKPPMTHPFKAASYKAQMSKQLYQSGA